MTTLVGGVDSSTQSCKVVIRDLATGSLVRTGRARHPPGTEVEPSAWWDALVAAIVDSGGLADVAAMSIAAQQHAMVVLDSAGRVIRPALLWNDPRSAQAARDLVAEVGSDEYVHRTGAVPVASFTATKLRWLRDAEPENAARVAAVALPHDWLTWRLRGYGPAGEGAHGPVLEELTTDRSEASGTAYWSPTTGDYDLELFERALGHSAILPRVLGQAQAAGKTAAFPGVPPGIVVGPGAGDNAGAALGLGTGAGDVVLSIGTSGTISAVAARPSMDRTGTVAGFADASGLFLPLVATLNAARVLSSIAELLGVDHDGLSRLALQAQPGSAGVVLVPYFEGERTPNLPDAKASLHGLTIASSTQANIARAAIEGMLCGLATGLDALRAVGVHERRIMLIGGAAQNVAVTTAAGQVFDAPVVVPAPGEYVAGGAAVQAGWTLSGQRPLWPLPIVAEPAPDHRAVIRDQYSRYARRAGGSSR